MRAKLSQQDVRADFLTRSHLKKVFWPNICVGALFQVLDIQKYACGLKLGPALILNQNPFFEMASSQPHESFWLSVEQALYINFLTQFAGAFKGDDLTLPEQQISAGGRIAAAARSLVLDAEFAEARYQDIVSSGQGIFDDL